MVGKPEARLQTASAGRASCRGLVMRLALVNGGWTGNACRRPSGALATDGGISHVQSAHPVRPLAAFPYSRRPTAAGALPDVPNGEGAVRIAQPIKRVSSIPSGVRASASERRPGPWSRQMMR
jgi:hypothetical protein